MAWSLKYICSKVLILQIFLLTMLVALRKFTFIITIIASLVLLWMVVMFYGVFKVQAKEVKQPFQVSSTAKVHVELRSKEMVNRLLTSVLLDGEGDELINKLKNSKGNKDQQAYGINFLAPVHYFEDVFENGSLKGVLVEVSNKRDWLNNANKLLGNTSVAKLIDGVGIVVQSRDLQKEQLTKYVESLSNSKQQNSATFLAEDLLHFQFNQDDAKIKGRLHVHKSSVEIDGTTTFHTPREFGDLSSILVPSGFHFSTDLVTSEINDQLQRVIKLPSELTAISMNYRGVQLLQSEQGSYFVPDLDAVFVFEEIVSIADFVTSLTGATLQADNRTFLWGNKQFYVKQLGEKTIAFGNSSSVEYQNNNTPIGIKVQGNSGALFNVEGNKLLQMGLRMNKQVALAMDLSKKIEFIQLQFSPINDRSFQIKGAARTKENQDIVLTILSILIQGN